MLLVMSLFLAGAEAPAAPMPKPEKICREIKQETGTHMRAGRRCKSAEEWAREDEKNSHLPIDTMIRHNEGDVKADLARPH